MLKRQKFVNCFYLMLGFGLIKQNILTTIKIRFPVYQYGLCVLRLQIIEVQLY